MIVRNYANAGNIDVRHKIVFEWKSCVCMCVT